MERGKEWKRQKGRIMEGRKGGMEGWENWMHTLAHDHPCAQDHPGVNHGFPFMVPLTARVPVQGALGIEGWE